jgi:hypothetical protein
LSRRRRSLGEDRALVGSHDEGRLLERNVLLAQLPGNPRASQHSEGPRSKEVRRAPHLPIPMAPRSTLEVPTTLPDGSEKRRPTPPCGRQRRVGFLRWCRSRRTKASSQSVATGPRRGTERRAIWARRRRCPDPSGSWCTRLRGCSGARYTGRLAEHRTALHGRGHARRRSSSSGWRSHFDRDKTRRDLAARPLRRGEVRSHLTAAVATQLDLQSLVAVPPMLPLVVRVAARAVPRRHLGKSSTPQSAPSGSRTSSSSSTPPGRMTWF